jgi:hypothetical protein
MKPMLQMMRSVVAGLLGIKAEEASNGDWWEVDFILVILLGSGAAGIIAWMSI